MKIKYQPHLIFFLLFNSLFLTKITAQIRTVGLVKYTNANKNGYCLFSPFGTKKTFLIDKCGRKVNEWTSSYNPGLSVTLLPNGKLLRAGSFTNSSFGAGVGGILEMYDWSGNLVWSYQLSDSFNTFHHDFKVMPNGNILAIIWESHTPSECIAAGRNPANTKVNVWSERIEELTPYGTDSAIVVWKWRVWDHLIQDFDSSKSNYGVVSDHPELFDINFSNGTANYGQDWFHFNSLDYNVDLDQILISSHSLSEIYIIDHSTTTGQAASHSGGRTQKGGDILYRWGNPQAYKQGNNSSDIKIFHGHHATWVPKWQNNAGKILFFNNGMGRLPKQYSSVDMISPPLKTDGTYTYTSGSHYAPDTSKTIYKDPVQPQNFFSTVMGGVYPIDNGRYMVTNATSGTFFELNSDTIVWKYVNPYTGLGTTDQGKIPTANNWVFRCEFYPPEYPGFSGKSMVPGDEIESSPYTQKLCEKPVPPLYTIKKINKQNITTGVNDSLGVKCRITGTLQGINLRSPGFDMVIADSTGGMRVFSPLKTFGLSLNQGDSIMVWGVVGQDKGWGTMVNVDSVIFIANGKLLKKVKQMLKADETQESALIQLHRVKLVNPMDWPISSIGPNSFKRIAIQHTDGSLDSMLIYEATNLDGTPTPQGYLDITGLVGQTDYTKPYKSSYVIIPRSLTDITPASLPVVVFPKKEDTVVTSAGTYVLSCNSLPLEENFKFNLVVKGGTAIPQTDYAFTATQVSVSKTTGIPSTSVSIPNKVPFQGYRDIVFAIRSVQGPGMIGADSTFRLVLEGNENDGVEHINTVKTKVFPNPSNGQVHVVSDILIKTIVISDAVGRKVLDVSPMAKTYLQASELPTGYYNMTLMLSDGSLVNEKIMVLR